LKYNATDVSSIQKTSLHSWYEVMPWKVLKPYFILYRYNLEASIMKGAPQCQISVVPLTLDPVFRTSQLNSVKVKN